MRSLGCKVAVVTNASLLWRDDVRADLAKADWVSLKVDSVHEDIWRRINRPHGALRLSRVLHGMQMFAQAYAGELVTETMLVRGINDAPEHVEAIGGFLAQLRPARAYLGIPTRPPAEAWVRPPDEETVNRCYQIVSAHVKQVEHLIGYEGNAFASTGNLEDDLLAITAVHPMRAEAVGALLERAGADWSVIRTLVEQGKLVETEFQERKFYLRRFDTSTHG